jgi:chromosome segregation ATPase
VIRYFEMACPRCLNPLRIRGEYSGRRVICNHCEQAFLADPGETPPSEAGAGEPAGPDPAIAAELDALRAEAERLGAALLEKDARLALLESQVERSEARLAESTSEWDRERAAWERRLEEARAHWASERESLEAEAGRLRQEADARDRELGEVRLRVGMIAGDRDELLSRIEQSEARATLREAELTARIAELATSAEESDRRSLAEVDRLGRELDMSRAREQAQAGCVEELAGRLRELEAERGRRSAEMEALRVGRWVEAEAMRRQSETDARRHREELERLQSEAETARRESEVARGEAEAAREEAVTARSEAEFARNEADAARGEAEAAGRERDQAVARATTLEQERDRLEGLLASQESRHRAVARSLTEELERLSEALAEVREGREAASRRAEESDAVVAGLRSELDELRRAHAESAPLNRGGSPSTNGHDEGLTVIDVELIDEPNPRVGVGAATSGRTGIAHSRGTDLIGVDDDGRGNSWPFDEPGVWTAERLSDVDDLREARHRIALLAGWLRESAEANSRLLDLVRGQREAGPRLRPHTPRGWGRRRGDEVGEDRWESEFNWHLQVGRQLAEMQKRRGQK